MAADADERRSPRHEGAFDVAIVGAGPSGTYLLDRLRRARRARPLRVAVLDPAEAPGAGLPYDGGRADPVHTFGRTSTPRVERGAQLRAIFARAIAPSPGLVPTHVRAEVRDVERAAGGFALRTDRATLLARAVVLACGHWHRPEDDADPPADRWDAARVRRLAEGATSVAVLGSAQSAIDAALALAWDRGAFDRAPSGDLEWRARTPLRVALRSRRGLLPRVVGHVDRARLPLPESVGTLAELAAAMGAEGDVVPLAERLARGPVTAARFAARVARARASIAACAPIPGQQRLFDSLSLVHRSFPRLPAEDRLALAPLWTPLMTVVEAINVVTAERLDALLRAGALDVGALGDAPSWRRDGAGWIVGGERFDAAIDARGMPTAIPRDHLLGRLVACGLLREGRVAYADRARGELVVGGVDHDPDTLRVRTERGLEDALFVMGPATIGHVPLYTGLMACRWSAARIADALGAL
jgi:hypothetical protein